MATKPTSTSRTCSEFVSRPVSAMEAPNTNAVLRRVDHQCAETYADQVRTALMDMSEPKALEIIRLALGQGASTDAPKAGPSPVTLPAPPPPRTKPVAAESAKKDEDSKKVARPLTGKAGEEGPLKVATSTEKAVPRASPPPSPPESGAYFVQIGAYKEKRNAEAARRKIEGDTSFTGYTVASPGGTLVILRVGSYKSRREAVEASRRLKDMGFSDCFIKSER